MQLLSRANVNLGPIKLRISNIFFAPPNNYNGPPNQEYKRVLRARGNDLPVVAETESPQRKLVAGKCFNTDELAGVPQRDEAIGAPGRKVAAKRDTEEAV